VEDLELSANRMAESAQRVVDRAVEESRRREHSLITNEHIFLAFAQVEWDMFSQVMRDLDLNPHEILQALEEHLRWLDEERDLLDRRATSVRRTLTALKEGRDLMAEEMLDGFDHSAHRAEVEERWGTKAWATGDAWWRAQSPAERAQWAADQRALTDDWAAAAAAGSDPASADAQALAGRHVAWLGSVPGTPGAGGEPDLDYVVGLGEMYVADERFAANYGGDLGARLVRDALRVWADARR